MQTPEPLGSSEDNEAIIVKADEVDEAGADISTISPENASESEFTDRIETRRALGLGDGRTHLSRRAPRKRETLFFKFNST